MISFRYHLVSVVGIFLALALGIVIGTTALNGPITKDLRNQVNDAKDQRDKLAGQVKTLQGQVTDAGQFASTYGSKLVAGTLTGKSVLVLALPGATVAEADGISKEIGAAGGKLAGRVTITQNYLDPSNGTGITSLATGPAHPIGLTLPETSDTGQLGGALLAYVLLGKGQATDVTQVLGGFSQLHMVQTSSDTKPANAVVILAHGALPTNGYAGASELALVGAMVKAGGHVVVAGDANSARKGGLVALVRNDAVNRDAAATVDDANSPIGQVSTALAMADVLKGQVGHYGTGTGANALFPAPGN